MPSPQCSRFSNRFRWFALPQPRRVSRNGALITDAPVQAGNHLHLPTSKRANWCTKQQPSGPFTVCSCTAFTPKRTRVSAATVRKPMPKAPAVKARRQSVPPGPLVNHSRRFRLTIVNQSSHAGNLAFELSTNTRGQGAANQFGPSGCRQMTGLRPSVSPSKWRGERARTVVTETYQRPRITQWARRDPAESGE
jgi:hypothetical protein